MVAPTAPPAYTQEDKLKWLMGVVANYPGPYHELANATLAEFARLLEVEREYRDSVDTLEVGS